MLEKIKLLKKPVVQSRPVEYVFITALVYYYTRVYNTTSMYAILK